MYIYIYTHISNCIHHIVPVLASVHSIISSIMIVNLYDERLFAGCLRERGAFAATHFSKVKSTDVLRSSCSSELIFQNLSVMGYLWERGAFAVKFFDMGWLRLAGSLKLQVSLAKEPCKRDDILQKRRII